MTKKANLDDFTVAWVGREFHPPATDDGAVYLFLERPTKGRYSGAHYFWRTSDPSYKIKFHAGLAAHLKLKPGSLHPILTKIDGAQQ